ncbi:hypothetical protein PSACC_02559 [Paramicrosporidium saccamoebae]|uniref:STAS domain-containing protein n=1 Tax=Paramicrosporidium saccamoebae TaxID=1246581 RepID=A0A2H9TIN9_9FUNG|nr:hypothetical protein PSACC_02559 [Paramicrosporidium saccamoebae]
MNEAHYTLRWMRTIISWLLAVFVSTLLNLMDAVTYGRLLFPTHIPLFSQYDFHGVSMYLLCTTTAQLVISVMSSFKRGATACGMVESIPFFHAISIATARRVMEEDRMMATILTAYMLVAVCTALFFLGLALLNMDKMVHKFPRVVLVGSMGGIGLFLIVTGLEISLNETFSVWKWYRLFSSWVTFGLWSIGILASVVALIAESKYKVPFVTPILSLLLLVGFYLVILPLNYTMDDLREFGWLLRPPEHRSHPLDIYALFSPRNTDWVTIFTLIPVILGAALFGSLHVPINVPSFARLTNQTFSMKRELFTQSISNMITSIVGFVPNYFVYTNSLLFLRAGGTHRFSGLLLAASTGMMLFYGLGALGYIPTVIVMFLVLYLGVGLVWEATYESFWLCSRTEYAMIWLTMMAMQLMGFVSGLFVGVSLAAIYAQYTLKMILPVLVDEDDCPDICTPAIQKLYQRTLDRCLVVGFSGCLYFGNSVEELQKLTFTSLDSRVLILDFRRVTSIDLNAREGILAAINSGLLTNEGTQLAFLGVSDEPLRRNLARIGGIMMGVDGPHRWLHQLIQRITTQENDETRLLLTDEQLPCSNEDWIEYDQIAQEQRGVLQRLRPLATVVNLHRGTPIRPSAGLIIVTTGSIRIRTKNYLPGSWVYVKEGTDETKEAVSASAAVTGQATTKSTLLYIQTKHLSDIPSILL